MTNSTADRDGWLERIAAIRQWSQRGERAPHKPLLLLYALGQLQSRGDQPIAYAEAEPRLRGLLGEFGPPRSTSPAYPFRRLANDEGLWRVETPSGADPGDSAGRLRALEADGQLTPKFADALQADPGLVVLIARYLLDDNWPSSLHDEILIAVGLDLDAEEVALTRGRLGEVARRRDPAFRQYVLLAYEYRCALCGFDGRFDTSPVALDAAHIRWWSSHGPDTVDNGACLCSIHHVLFDKGVLGVNAEHEVVVSKHFIGRGPSAQALVLDLAGQPITEPETGDPAPADEHLRWHAEEVFRHPARTA